MKSKNNKPNQLVKPNMQPRREVAGLVACSTPEHATKYSEILNRMKEVLGAKSDTGFAKMLGLRQSSVSSAKKREQIPPAWAIQVAEKTGASLDWLLLGKECAPEEGQGWNEGQERRTPIYNDMVPQPEQAKGTGGINVPARDYKISELIQKTIEVLESDTICKIALTSNIEAFHEYVMSQEQIDRLHEKITSQQKQMEHFQFQQNKMFQEMQKEIQSVKNENQQLREEMQRDRDQEVTEDTG